MEIIDIRQDDDLRTIARKAEANFRQLAVSITGMVRKQGRLQDDAVRQEIITAVGDMRQYVDDEVTRLTDEVIPAEVNMAFPPIGSYLLVSFDPSESYPGTVWQQVDSVTTDNNATIPLWQRTVV